MSQEIELKLSVPDDQINSLRNHSFWRQYAKASPDTLHLGNTYFDTAQRDLNRAKVALRIRDVNGQFIQTLKTKGDSVNGLTRRGEWEWPLATATLDTSLLTPVLPEVLQSLDADALKPLFTTDFDRTRWLIQWESPAATVEAALDIGKVRCEGRSLPIRELELELIDGDEGALQVIAQQLSAELGLLPANESKAERGFRLLESSQG